MNLHPIILAGGSGTRLWPMSREAYPKQFLALLPGGASPFQATVRRLAASAAPQRRPVSRTQGTASSSPTS